MADDLMMVGNDSADDIFGSPAPAENASIQQDDLAGMLGGDNEDEDLFGAPTPVNPAPVATSTALDDWKAAKDKEISERDAKEQEQISAMKEIGSKDLSDFNHSVDEAQQKRAVHNKEVDAQMIADIESEAAQKWEKVVSLIDFNRSDLHERDIGRMKSLLLQLKH